MQLIADVARDNGRFIVKAFDLDDDGQKVAEAKLPSGVSRDNAVEFSEGLCHAYRQAIDHLDMWTQQVTLTTVAHVCAEVYCATSRCGELVNYNVSVGQPSLIPEYWTGGLGRMAKLGKATLPVQEDATPTAYELWARREITWQELQDTVPVPDFGLVRQASLAVRAEA